MNDRIEKRIELAAPVSRVWRALTDYREFGEWFRVKLDGPLVRSEAREGCIKRLQRGGWRASLVPTTIRSGVPEVPHRIALLEKLGVGNHRELATGVFARDILESGRPCPPAPWTWCTMTVKPERARAMVSAAARVWLRSAEPSLMRKSPRLRKAGWRWRARATCSTAWPRCRFARPHSTRHRPHGVARFPRAGALGRPVARRVPKGFGDAHRDFLQRLNLATASRAPLLGAARCGRP